ncbi:leucine-rich PPR motif-containing protein, mitochondrial [Cydia splendana]|uniref:leucine-rich PPR motif-containing protein, mitochondrial n=1 Tax=Cydia splendana TaxID=1100963 RepID=UPI0021299718
MLTRNCFKITSASSRALLLRNYLLHEKRLPSQCSCQFNFSKARSNDTKVLAKVANTTKDLRVSSGSGEKVNSVTSQILGSSEELLEKMIAGLSSDIHQKNRVYKNDLVKVIGKVKELNFSSKRQGLLLLQCCTELLPDETPATRIALAEEVWAAIKPHTKFTVEHYNELLRVYIANGKSVKASTFINSMAPVIPNNTTYELILRALGETGDINQATEVLANMKNQGLPATESVFNSLILCQGKAENYENVKEVLTMMKSLKFEHTIDTHTSISRALAFNKKEELLLKEMEMARQNGHQFEETHVMEIVKSMAAGKMYKLVPKILHYLPETTLKTPSISPYMQSVCTLLVYQNHPLVALEIYKCLPLPSFGPKDDQGLHGRSLVRDCVKAGIPSTVLSTVTEQLMSSGRNPIAIQNAAECALQQDKALLAIDLFDRMKQHGLPIRPHYFWPIMLRASKNTGEKGIMNTLTKMIEMDVKPDYETISTYTLPYVSFTSAQNLMKKFQDAGVSVTTVLTPMMEYLLNTGQVRAASEICELFKGKVDMEILLKPLIKGYLISLDLKSSLHILEDGIQKASDKSKDWTGRFLCTFMKKKNEFGDVFKFVKELRKTPLRISTSAADFCLTHIPESVKEETVNQFKEAIIAITDERLIDEGELFAHQLPHPKNMNEEGLKAHLSELEAKGMNTRGVLRRLLQQYCKEGNLTAAREIIDKCQKEGIFLSAGMKAAIFDLHVKSGELELAELALADLNKSSPNFTLDEFKVIDFATMWVCRKETEKAFAVIEEQSKKRRVMGGRGIAMNCFRLLDATATHGTLEDVKRMLDLLTRLRYCQPTNAMLGPVVRWHLNNNDLREAVNEFSRLAQKYNKTPLKHELLCKILETISDGGEDRFVVNANSGGWANKLAQTVFNVNKRIHGASDVQLTLIAALAEVNYKKTLRKMFLDPNVKFHPDALLRRCERFADEKKTAPLHTIAECAKDTRRIDLDEVYELILSVHQRQDDWRSALALWEKMQESDVRPSQKFLRNLYALLKANKIKIPPQLSTLMDRQEASQ